jgi:hypothetical protein
LCGFFTFFAVLNEKLFRERFLWAKFIWFWYGYLNKYSNFIKNSNWVHSFTACLFVCANGIKKIIFFQFNRSCHGSGDNMLHGWKYLKIFTFSPRFDRAFAIVFLCRKLLRKVIICAAGAFLSTVNNLFIVVISRE